MNKDKIRRLTVCRRKRFRIGPNYEYTPVLRLCGKWLWDTGFRSGQIVAVYCSDRKLVIVPVSDPDGVMQCVVGEA